MSVDPDLLATWTRGWAQTRDVSAPVRDRDAWRIEVGFPDQLRRYVYADLCDDVARRADEIDELFVFLKVCAEPDRVTPLFSSAWDVRATGIVMVQDAPMGGGREPDDGFRLERSSQGSVRFCALVDPDGQEAARGRAVRVDDRVIYDRIAVAPEHRRRGLGTRVMRTLQAEMGGWGQGVLVATEEGALLYASLGWRLISAYTTAVRRQNETRSSREPPRGER